MMGCLQASHFFVGYSWSFFSHVILALLHIYINKVSKWKHLIWTHTSKVSILFFPKHERCGCRQKGTSGRCSKKSILTNPQNRLYHQHGWRPQQRAFDYQTIYNAVSTNYMGTINVAMEAYAYLKESKGKLVFFTSSSYTRGRAFYSIYSSTKAAIVNFVQAIAQEWEPFGIAVNCINPERTKTPMRVKNFGTEPENTLLSAEKVAIATIQSLISEFTGQVIDVKRNEV